MSRYGGPNRNTILVSRRVVNSGQQAMMREIIKENRPRPSRHGSIMEAKHLLEMGPCSPPLKIYRPDAHGHLVLAEVVSAMDFRLRGKRRIDAKSPWRETMRSMLPVGPKRPRGRPRKALRREGTDA